LPKKLGIKQGARVVVVHPPANLPGLLADLPIDARVEPFDQARAADVALLFARQSAALEGAFQALAEAIRPAGGLWVCWPKRASGIATDLDENVVRLYGLSCGLVDNKVCAIDETWSGLRFVYRLKDR
jgi:hypothetical protein